MSAPASIVLPAPRGSWAGFDYTLGQPVVRTHAEWRALRQAARSEFRAGGDLHLKGADGRITAEIYDRGSASGDGPSTG